MREGSQRVARLLVCVSLFVALEPAIDSLHFLTTRHFWCYEHHRIGHVAKSESFGSSDFDEIPGVHEQKPSGDADSEHSVCQHIFVASLNSIHEHERFEISHPDGVLRRIDSRQSALHSAPLLSYAPKLSPPLLPVNRLS